MATATLTFKGQLTLPKPIRDLLRVQAGDKVEFIAGDGDEVRVRAAHSDVRELRGLLRRPGRKPVTIEDMDAAIQRAHGHHR